MSGIIKLPTVADVEEEAASWVWRLDSEAVTDADRQTFESWIRRDPRNRLAFAALGGVWKQLDELIDAKRPEKVATFADVPERRPSRRAFLLAAGIAATVAVVVGIYSYFPREVFSDTVATAVGQHRSVTLPDDSVVTLNTNSIVETHLTPIERDLYLRKGEAYFVVAHDRLRPLFVHAGNTVVRAVGTAFDVRVRDGAHVEVMVSEGKVEVRAAASASTGYLGPRQTGQYSAARVLDAGERLVNGPEADEVQPMSARDIASSMAWQQGAVVFEGQPLAEAAAELSRYTDTRFVVTDPSIKVLPIGGRFRTDDVDGFLSALEAAFPVVIRHAPGSLVYIEPRS